MQSKFVLKVLGLCALLIGLMSIGAGAAQAETGASWSVNPAPDLQATLENNHSVLLTKLSNKNIHLLCTAVELEEAFLVESGGSLSGKARFSGCVFLELLVGGGTKEFKACNPENGIVLTNKIKGLITLHEKQGRITVSPFEAGGTFANIFLGLECAFGENLKVSGVLVLKDCQNALSTYLVIHLVEEDKVLTKLWVNSETNPATFDGSINTFLSGAKTGGTWKGNPA
jgi:hypothetical protein